MIVLKYPCFHPILATLKTSFYVIKGKIGFGLGSENQLFKNLRA